MYMTVKQAAEKWGISDRRVRILCSEGKIPGVTREGRSWKIPEDAKKPEDGRYKTTEKLLEKIDRKKTELDSRRPLTEGEVERLTEEFVVEYTYNSNAIEGNTLTLRETDMVLRGLTIDKKPLKDHMEAVGHKEAFYFVQNLVKEQVPLSESVIKQIHYLVLADKKDDRGVYRRVPVRIMGAKHEPVQPYLIQPKMEELLDDYRSSTEHIIPRLARFCASIDLSSSTRIIDNISSVAGCGTQKIRLLPKDRFCDILETNLGPQGHLSNSGHIVHFSINKNKYWRRWLLST